MRSLKSVLQNSTGHNHMSELNDILMPKLGLTMTEGSLAEWSVEPGQQLKAGDLMFVVETDKVATEILAPSDGRLEEILVAQGETVSVGTPVARWTGVGQASAPGEEANAVANQNTASAQQAGRAIENTLQTEPTRQDTARVVATPLARKLARQEGLALQQVAGSGPGGRIKAADVRAFVQQRPAGGSTQTQTNAAESGSVPAATAGHSTPPSAMVQAMARRMVEAKQQTPHFYLSSEAEVSELLTLRERLNQDDAGVKLTVNHFLVAAVAHALRLCPWQNRIWTENGIIAFESVDVGLAVSTEKGLMAPVLQGLSGCSLDGIAERANALVDRVRAGQARQEDLSGGAITISNAGMFNVTYMAPIINPPQSAILGVGSVRELFRPGDVGQPELRREMGLVLACDHRLHDGSSGLKFLNTVIDLLQNPYRLLRSLS